jgi:hypothetical protein
MRTSPSPSYGHWIHPSYEVKVRGTTIPMYLWGSAGITKDIVFDKPLVLHIHNDLFGEDISLGTQKAGIQESLGTLKPGECVSIPLNSISGVFASCEKESAVCCLIK